MMRADLQEKAHPSLNGEDDPVVAGYVDASATPIRATEFVVIQERIELVFQEKLYPRAYSLLYAPR